MYTVYDFINNDISSKHMRLGWKIEAADDKLVLRYTMLNFDWKSLEFLGQEAFDMFLLSKSYANLKQRLNAAMKKKGRLYLETSNISEMKLLAKHFNIHVDIDKIVSSTVAKKIDKMKSKETMKHEC